MRDWPSYTPVVDALELLWSNSTVRPKTEMEAVKNVYGRVLAEDVASPGDVPGGHLSHMDGFAVRARDLSAASIGNPVRLRLRGEVVLGEEPGFRLGRGEAASVSTGSSLPEGSDSVLMAEDARRVSGLVETETTLKRGENVYRRGTDIRAGDVALRKGTLLKAQDVGLLMLLGLTEARVYTKPRVGLLATGSELTDSATPGPGKIINTHSPMFSLIVRELGCIPQDFGIVPDDSRRLAAALKRAVASCDLVLVMGGTSRGRRDLGETTLRRLRPRALFHGLALDRGRVSGGAVVGGRPVLLVPGPVQAAMNCFLVLGVPLLGRLLGGKDLVERVPVVLSSDWRARERFGDFTKVVYLRIIRGERALVANVLTADTESATLLSQSNGFAQVPPEVKELKRGEELMASLLPGFSDLK